MRFDPAVHHRRSIRLTAFDYRSAGAYFVTICTHERALIFDDPRTRRAVELACLSVGRYCRPVSVDVFVVMPNHVHAIIWLATNDRDTGAGCRCAAHGPSERHRANRPPSAGPGCRGAARAESATCSPDR